MLFRLDPKVEYRLKLVLLPQWEAEVFGEVLFGSKPYISLTVQAGYATTAGEPIADSDGKLG